jgi:hypothetical protein
VSEIVRNWRGRFSFGINSRPDHAHPVRTVVDVVAVGGTAQPQLALNARVYLRGRRLARGGQRAHCAKPNPFILQGIDVRPRNIDLNVKLLQGDSSLVRTCRQHALVEHMLPLVAHDDGTIAGT